MKEFYLTLKMNIEEELKTLLQAWKNAGVASKGDYENKITDLEAKLKEVNQKLAITPEETSPPEEPEKPSDDKDGNKYDNKDNKNAKTLLLDDKVGEALNILKGSDTENQDSYLLLLTRYNRLKQNENRGTISFDNANIEKNKIVDAILNLMKQ